MDPILPQAPSADLAAELGRRWAAGKPVPVEAVPAALPAAARTPEAILALIREEARLRRQAGRVVRPEDYQRRFPALAAAISELFRRETESAPLAPAPATLTHEAAAWPETLAPDTQGGHPSAAAPATQTEGGIGLTAPYFPEADKAGREKPSIPGYEVLGELGRGGMGVVYKARDTRLKRTVALKMILAGPHAGDAQVARFRTEAEAVARFQHPGIVQIFEVGEHNGLPYCALEYVEGGSLDRHIGGQPLPAAEAAALAEELARAVHYAHQRKVIHRDLKPANVLLALSDASQKRPSGQPFCEGSLNGCVPKVTDFGLAKQLDDDGQTQSGAIMGTPSYMAPEQAEGRIHDMGPAVDIYALGAILYEMLTGRPPFRGPTLMATLELVRSREPEPPGRSNAHCPRDLETICLKCLEKEPGRRYASALALAQDLERFRAGEPILARPEGTLRRLGRRLRRRRVPIAAGVVVAAALAAVLFFAAGTQQARQKGDLVADIQGRLDAGNSDWTPEYADDLDERIDRLEGLDPTRAAELRPRVVERYGKVLEADLRLPRLEPDDVTRIKAGIAAVARRDPAAGKELRDQLARRSNRWETVHDLKAPFAGWTQTFAAQDVTLEKETLRSRRTDRLVRTRLDCSGNAQWEAHFQDWESAAEVGIGLSVVPGHVTNWAAALAFAHRERLLASGGHDRRVLLWDLTTGQRARSLEEDGPVEALAWSADDRRLFVAASTHLSAWDPVSGKRLEVVKAAPAEPFRCVAVASGGQVLAASGGKVIRLYRPDTLEPIGVLKGHTGPVNGLAFSADGRLLASGSEDGTARLWDAPDWTARTFVPTHPGAVATLALAPDASTLVCAAGRRLHAWNLSKQALAWKVPYVSSFPTLVFAPDGRRLLAQSQVIDLARPEQGTPLPFGPSATAWGSDGRTVAILDGNGVDFRVQLFDPATWQERARLCGTGYDLILSASPDLLVEGSPEGKPVVPPTFARVRQQGGSFWLQIRRNGVVQYRQAVRLPTGPLVLRASREGDRLSVQAGDLLPLTAFDPSPLSFQEAVGTLTWPARVSLTRLVTRRQTRAAAPSSLEQGDALLLHGQAAEALRHFDRHVLANPLGAAAQEGRYKAARCLLRLDRADEARARLEALAAESGQRWPLLAAVELWSDRLSRQKLDEAEVIFTALSDRYSPEILQQFLPLDFRIGILDRYPYRLANVVFSGSGRPERIEHLNRMADFLGMEQASPARWGSLRVGLVRHCWYAGDEDKARKLAREALQRLALQPPSITRSFPARFLLADYIWLLLRAHKAQEVLREAERWMPPADSTHVHDTFLREVLEMGRVCAYRALGDLDGAERVADAGLVWARKLPRRPPLGSYFFFAEIHLLKGLIREQRSDSAGALAAWKAGTFEAWQAEGNDPERVMQPDTALALRDDMVLCAWSGQGDDAAFARKFRNLLALFSQGSLPAESVRLLRMPPTVVRDVWKTPRGREVVRRSLFRESSLREAAVSPILLLEVGYLREGAMPAMTAAEEEVLWKGLDGLFELYRAGKLPQARLLQLGLAWKQGVTGFLGWGSVAPVLPPDVRGPIAYALAFHLEKLGQKDDARKLFLSVGKLAAKGSPLEGLARAQAERLGKP